MTPQQIALGIALLQRRRLETPPAQLHVVLTIAGPPGLDGPLYIGGSKAEYIAGLRRLRGEGTPDATDGPHMVYRGYTIHAKRASCNNLPTK